MTGCCERHSAEDRPHRSHRALEAGLARAMLHASALAGACAGLVSSIVTCPLDVVKTRLQAQTGPSKPLRQGWNGPAGHPNGSIGGGGARLAWEALQKSQAIKEVITGESSSSSATAAEARYEGLVGESILEILKRRKIRLQWAQSVSNDRSYQAHFKRYGGMMVSEASTEAWDQPSLGICRRGRSTSQSMIRPRRCSRSNSTRRAKRAS